MRFCNERTMKLWSLILLIGNCCFHWTTAVPITPGNYHVSIDNGILKNVSASTDVSSVDLSGSDIESIGENSLDGLTNIKILNLSNNKLKNLPPLIFSKLNNLEELSLANNSISSFNKTFIGLSSLKLLNISNNSMRYLKEGHLFGLTKSTNVIVGGNDLWELSSRAFKDPFVPELAMNGESSVSYAGEREIWKLFQCDFKFCMTDYILESVEEISEGPMSDNCTRISYVKSAVQKPRSVPLRGLNIKGFKHGWYKIKDDYYTEIDLSHNQITDVTSELINNLPSAFDYIDLKGNQIETIKNNGIEHKNLMMIDLENNRISTIEDGAFEKMNLTVVNIRQNYLQSTAFLGTFPASIQKLYLSGNSISEIPLDSFRRLKELKFLSLLENRVENIEPGTFKNQGNLLVLDFAFNQIRELRPKVFQGLTNLYTLDLRVNKIERISRDSFKGLKGNKDSVIHLGSNNISTIEEGSFSHLELKTIELVSNNLGDDSIAEGAFHGSNMKNLDLTSNSIAKINGELFNGIAGNYKLSFCDNPIKSIEKGAAKYMENVTSLDLCWTQLQILGNGALFGLSTERNVVIDLYETPIKIIQAGVFDDV